MTIAYICHQPYNFNQPQVSEHMRHKCSECTIIALDLGICEMIVLNVLLDILLFWNIPNLKQ